MNSAAGERREIEYAVHGGVSLKGHFYAPRGPGKFPVVIAVHGGGWRLANLDNYRTLGPWLAGHGYGVLAVTHRLSKPAEKVYPEAVQDVRAAVQFVKAEAAELKADPEHIALMGDPTLRQQQVAPPTALTATSASGRINLAWTPSTDSVLGYHVYRATNAAGPFPRVSTSVLTTPAFSDPSPLAGTNTYIVRAVKLETTPSGTFTNQSQGLFVSASASATTPLPVKLSLTKQPAAMLLSWPSQIGQTYRVVYNSRLNDTNWTQLGSTITAMRRAARRPRSCAPACSM